MTHHFSEDTTKQSSRPSHLRAILKQIREAAAHRKTMRNGFGLGGKREGEKCVEGCYLMVKLWEAVGGHGGEVEKKKEPQQQGGGGASEMCC